MSFSLTPTLKRVSGRIIRSLVERIDIDAEMTILLKTGQVLRAPVLGRTGTLDLVRREWGRDGRFWCLYEAEVEPRVRGARDGGDAA